MREGPIKTHAAHFAFFGSVSRQLQISPSDSESSQSRTEEDGDHLPKSRRSEVFIMSLPVFVWERERRVQPRPPPPPPLLLRSLLLLSIYFPLRWRPGCAIAHFLLLLALKHFSILKIEYFKGQFWNLTSQRRKTFYVLANVSDQKANRPAY